MIRLHDGSVWGTGVNKYGQLGVGSRDNSQVFLRSIPSGAKAVTAGSYHSMVLRQDGTVWTTGSDQFGQLGMGGNPNNSRKRNIFVDVNGVAGQ